MEMALAAVSAKRPGNKQGSRRQIARLVKRLRRAKGWSQKQLGNRCGYSDSGISRIEDESRPVSKRGLLAIAGAFGLTREQFLAKSKP